MTDRTYTHPDVFTVGVADGWAEAEADPTRIDWPARQARAALPFEVRQGRPVNPCETTEVRHGRNEMGFWGENLMADALATVTYRGYRYLLMIERVDGYGWAVPGGHVEPGESGTDAALRELKEETGLNYSGSLVLPRAARYVPDPRSSDEAWTVTVPVEVRFPEDILPPEVTGRDDARKARWIFSPTFPALERHTGGHIFAAHVPMLTEFLREVDR